MSRLKYLHDNYSPCQELWALVGECSSMQNVLEEVADLDYAVKHKREYHSIFVKLDDIKKDLSILRAVSSHCSCVSLLSKSNDDELPFPEEVI